MQPQSWQLQLLQLLPLLLLLPLLPLPLLPRARMRWGVRRYAHR